MINYLHENPLDDGYLPGNQKQHNVNDESEYDGQESDTDAQDQDDEAECGKVFIVQQENPRTRRRTKGHM